MARKEPLPPADQRFAVCEEAAQIAARLIRKYPAKFGELATARIAYFSQIGGIRLRGERKAATIATCRGQKKFLSRSPENGNEGWDYILIVCAESWARAGRELRERIIFHELRHALRGEQRTTGASVWKLVPHEFEGFYDEYEIYGDDRELRGLLRSLQEADGEDEEA